MVQETLEGQRGRLDFLLVGIRAYETSGMTTAS